MMKYVNLLKVKIQNIIDDVYSVTIKNKVIKKVL